MFSGLVVVILIPSTGGLGYHIFILQLFIRHIFSCWPHRCIAQLFRHRFHFFLQITYITHYTFTPLKCNVLCYLTKWNVCAYWYKLYLFRNHSIYKSFKWTTLNSTYSRWIRNHEPTNCYIKFVRSVVKL